MYVYVYLYTHIHVYIQEPSYGEQGLLGAVLVLRSTSIHIYMCTYIHPHICTFLHIYTHEHLNTELGLLGEILVLKNICIRAKIFLELSGCRTRLTHCGTNQESYLVRSWWCNCACLCVCVCVCLSLCRVFIESKSRH